MTIWCGDDMCSFANFRAPAKAGITTRTQLLAQEIKEWLVLNECKPNFAVIEEPFIDVHGSRTRASAQRQDVVKLTLFVGSLQAVLQDMGAQVFLVPVIRWKGQLPKELVWARAKDWLQWDQVDPRAIETADQATSHVQDSIALGIYAIKRLNSGQTP